MATKPYKIGVDIGTTSTKAVLYDEQLNVVASSSEGYDIIQLEDGMAEQNPQDIFEAVLSSIHSLMAARPGQQKNIQFLSFSSAMHSVMFLDRNHNPLTNCLIWADNRSAKVVRNLKKTMDWKELYRKTGTPVHSMTPLSKILWMKEHNPALFDRTKKIIGIKEYVLYKLTGDFKVDYSIASATGLFNIHHLDWDEEILDLAGIDRTYLAEAVDVTYTWETIKLAYSERMRISSNTALMIGASDGCLSNLGVGAIHPGETAITIGTSGAIRMVTDSIVLDPEGRTFCYYLAEDKWVIGGAVNNGGNVMSWLSSLFYPQGLKKTYPAIASELDLMNELAEEVEPGADGLFFYPYLNGERAPLWDPEAKGSYVGLSSFHKSGHLIRAAMEGVLFNLHDVWQVIQEVGGKSTSLNVTGGFLNSSLWKQMLADVFGQSIYLPDAFESSSLGAVLLAGLDKKDAGIDGEANLAMVEPSPETSASYQKLLPVYHQLSTHIHQMNETMKELRE